ncbi:uncharacterized protein LOC116775369 [Danaus plexippus]|uniref:uncharacterized protein LOC116775369 n=1 Tax=Danaus plexippus TaxID=13037 RepID=UPI002AB3126E|nr:uncharacterized protein LOC116775369 [Danaus plexippus]
MILRSCFYVLHLTVISAYNHQKPLPQKLWSERCTKNSIALNDCNWCWCDVRQRFQCKARICEEVDMFGHFKDAIRDIDVGMEGHGSWRSSMTPCTPGVHYRRGDVLCLCDEDGNWPNPVCRDIFRVLHAVEVHRDTVNKTCTPSKLYLIGCNVCFCSSSGILDPEFCTKQECQEDDPALPENRQITQSDYEKISEVYARCDSDEAYELGCRKCICLKNNRLICNDCSKEQTTVTEKPLYRKRRRKRRRKRIRNTRFGLCEGKYPREKFSLGCSTCFCDKYSGIYCSVRKCLKPIRTLKASLSLSQNDPSIVPPKVKQVEPPLDDDMCQSNTKYTKRCNECICLKLENNVKVLDCSLKKCTSSQVDEMFENDCVVGSVYMRDCRICYCYTIDGVRHQVCHANAECGENKNELDMGFCIPMRMYKKDCNTCKCLSDGKTLKCSSAPCTVRSSNPVSVDLVPVTMMNGDPCPKGFSYKLDCNVCFCLSNGNAICTTRDCSNDDQEF